MRDQIWFNGIAGVLVIVVLVGGAVALLSSSGGPTTPGGGANSSVPVVYRNLTISYDPSNGQYVYNSLELSTSLNVRTIFTITNYDTGVATLPSPSDAQVAGTYGGVITVESNGASTTVTSVPTDDVSHTFTMSDAYYHLNVPIPPAASASSPARVTFSVVFTSPGTYLWGCDVLCGQDGMMAQMWGSLTVE